MIRHLVLILLTMFLFCACQKSAEEELVGTWTQIKQIRESSVLKEPDKDTMQIRFTGNGEMFYLTNGERSGIGFYSYKIIGDSIRVTNIEIDSTGKRDSVILFTNKFCIRTDTLISGTDEQPAYFKKVTQ